MGDYVYEEKKNYEGKNVKVLGSTFEEGKPDATGNWLAKLTTHEERLGYLRTALRYWYSNEWYGSEKRKREA